jgi:hypothetical protein
LTFLDLSNWPKMRPPTIDMPFTDARRFQGECAEFLVTLCQDKGMPDYYQKNIKDMVAEWSQGTKQRPGCSLLADYRDCVPSHQDSIDMMRFTAEGLFLEQGRAEDHQSILTGDFPPIVSHCELSPSPSDALTLVCPVAIATQKGHFPLWAELPVGFCMGRSF